MVFYAFIPGCINGLLFTDKTITQKIDELRNKCLTLPCAFSFLSVLCLLSSFLPFSSSSSLPIPFSLSLSSSYSLFLVLFLFFPSVSLSPSFTRPLVLSFFSSPSPILLFPLPFFLFFSLPSFHSPPLPLFLSLLFFFFSPSPFLIHPLILPSFPFLLLPLLLSLPSSPPLPFTNPSSPHTRPHGRETSATSSWVAAGQRSRH